MEIDEGGPALKVRYRGQPGRVQELVQTAVFSHELTFRADDVLALFKTPTFWFEGAISGPDKLQNRVAPPGRTEKGAIRYIAERANHSIGSGLKSRGCPNKSCFVKIDSGATDHHFTCPQLVCAMQSHMRFG